MKYLSKIDLFYAGPWKNMQSLSVYFTKTVQPNKTCMDLQIPDHLYIWLQKQISK